MVALCGVCSTEPSKYRCPTCNLSSCSLTCSRTHKANCTPQERQLRNEEHDSVQPEATPPVAQPNGGQASPTAQQDSDVEFYKLEKSPELQELWARYPNLRSQLQDIYKTTLEEEWVETSEPTRGRGRGRGRGRYRGSHAGLRSRGPWTAEKGFKRGLGKVRRWRDSCEDGAGGIDNEGFMRLASLVLAESGSQKQAADVT